MKIPSVISASDLAGLETRIEAAEEHLARKTESHDRSETIWSAVMREEKSCGTTATGRTGYLAFLRWVHGHLEQIGVDPPAPYGCSCGDQGWIEVADTGTWIPCRTCNGKAFHLFNDGHYKPGHSCSECVGTRRKYQAAGDPRAKAEEAQTPEEREDAKVARELAEQAELL